ncbi:MAG TPA: hypothetical protein PKD61_24970, partial [Polyangiaceae bacterium]|nr:hypothetical protein [Polyangiaceae bacterium]
SNARRPGLVEAGEEGVEVLGRDWLGGHAELSQYTERGATELRGAGQKPCSLDSRPALTGRLSPLCHFDPMGGSDTLVASRKRAMSKLLAGIQLARSVLKYAAMVAPLSVVGQPRRWILALAQRADRADVRS